MEINNLQEFGERFARGRYELTEIGIYISGDLDCSDNRLTSLPGNLTVGGDLDCSNNHSNCRFLFKIL